MEACVIQGEHTCEWVYAAQCVYIWSVVCAQHPAVLGRLSSFLILWILNQDHTSHLSDDKLSFGHFCQQALLQSWENKDSPKSPFWLCSSSAASPSLCHLSRLLSYFTLRGLVSSLFQFFLFVKKTYKQYTGLSSSFLFLHLSFPLSLFPCEEINTISPPREKTNTDNPGHAAGVWPRISQPF